MPTYTGSRPSVRSLKANAAKPSARSVSLNSQRNPTSSDADDGLLADPVPRKHATLQEAESLVKARYPQYFKTIEQIQRDGGGSSRDANFTFKSNRESASSAINDTLRRLQMNYDKEYEAEKVRLDPIRREQDRDARDRQFKEEQSGQIEYDASQVSYEANTKTTPGKYFTKNERANMNRAEVYAAAGMGATGSKFAASIGQVQDFFQEIADMDPERQKEIFDEMKAEANDSVDSYYDTRTEQIRTRLSEKINQLNAKHGLLSETEKYKLDRAIGSLDREVAETLDQGIESIFKRGGADSGLMQRLADDIIAGRMTEVTDAERVMDFNLKSGELQTGQDKKNAELAAQEDLYDISQERQSERSQAYSDVFSDFVQQGLLQQVRGGATEAPFGESGVLTPPPSPKTRPIKTPTSTELARGFDTVAPPPQEPQQPLEFFSKGLPKTTYSINPFAAQQKPVAPTPVATAKNPLTGVTYSGGAAARLAARLAKPPK